VSALHKRRIPVSGSFYSIFVSVTWVPSPRDVPVHRTPHVVTRNFTAAVTVARMEIDSAEDRYHADLQ